VPTSFKRVRHLVLHLWLINYSGQQRATCSVPMYDVLDKKMFDLEDLRCGHQIACL
jgi:hypothetical protein